MGRRGHQVTRSSVYRTLVRNGLVEPKSRRRRRKDCRRWERGTAMELWQLDVTASAFLTTPNGFSRLSAGSTARRRRVWLPAVAAAGLSGIHLHDLRHAGNTFTANAGANLRELMERMGHSSTRAALIYLHGGRSAATGHRRRRQRHDPRGAT